MRRAVNRIAKAQRALEAAKRELDRSQLAETVRLARVNAALLKAIARPMQLDLSPLVPYFKAMYLLKKAEIDGSPSTASVSK